MPNVYFAPGGASADLGTTTDKWDKVYANSIYGDVLNADGTPKYAPASGGGGGGGEVVGGVPVGAIIAYAGNGELPSGFMECDHSEVSRTMFADLYAKIGTTYGAGDGSTTFNLPSVNDAKRFLQGDTVAGTVKSAGLPNITGSIGIVNHKLNTCTGAFYEGTASSKDYYASADKTTTPLFDASLSNPIYGNSTTVQPPALTTRYIIKAFDGQTADSALIDITQYAQELAGKADRDLDNLSAVGEAKIQTLSPRYLVDSYYDDTTGNWWREYDGGWVEQGGLVTGSSSSGGYLSGTVNLLKPMKDNKYNITTTGHYSGTGGYQCCINNVTNTSFGVLNLLSSASGTARWSVAGMGASV